MSSHEQVFELVRRAVNGVNEQRAEDEQIVCAPETPLVGDDGQLDSLGLIHLLVAIEEEIEESFRVHLKLTDEESVVSGPGGPLQNIGALVGYISQRLKA
jgi:acyl carrier protein